jgi:proteasome lid subunit RPN8/RPN11
MCTGRAPEDGTPLLVIPHAQLKKIIKHARDTYPYECCGILVGSRSKAGRRVTAVHPAQNKNKKQARDRYEIDPIEYMTVETSARESGAEVVGFYHSHPDHTPHPSTFDAIRAWPTSSLSYLIIGVGKSGPPKYRSWVWHPRKEGFEEEHLEVAGSAR